MDSNDRDRIDAGAYLITFRYDAQTNMFIATLVSYQFCLHLHPFPYFFAVPSLTDRLATHTHTQPSPPSRFQINFYQ